MITNRTIRNWHAPYLPKSTHRWRWLAIDIIWLGCAVATYIQHPLISTLPQIQRIGLSLIGITLYPLWVLMSGVWQTLSIGAYFLTPEQFIRLYAGLGVAILALPKLIQFWWLSKVASYMQATAFRIEQHRQQQGQLNSAESKQLLTIKGSGLPLAEIGEKGEGVRLGISAEKLEGHTLVIGPTRSGKSMHLTETLLQYDGAMVVVDPKGEQFERTAGYREQHVGPVYNIPAHSLDLTDYYDLGNRDDVAELHLHMLKVWQDSQPIFAEKTKILFSIAHEYARANNCNPLQVVLDLASTDPARALTAFMDVNRDGVMAFTNGRKPTNLDRFTSSAFGTAQTRLFNYQQHWQTITTSGTNTSVPMNWAEQRATIYITYDFNQLKGAGGCNGMATAIHDLSLN